MTFWVSKGSTVAHQRGSSKETTWGRGSLRLGGDHLGPCTHPNLVSKPHPFATAEERIQDCYCLESYHILLPDYITFPYSPRTAHTVSHSVVSDSCDPMVCSPPGSSVHGILQAEVWSGLPFPSPGESSRPWDQTQVSCTAGRFLTVWAPREAQGAVLEALAYYVPLAWQRNKATLSSFFLLHNSVSYFCLALGHREPRFLETRTVGLWTCLTLDDSETVYLRWDLNSCAGTQTQPKPMVPGFRN